MHVQDQSTPDHAGAASTCPPPALHLPALAAHLKQTCIGWPAYGLPFCYALDRALAHMERGAVLTRVSPTAYHVQALPHAMPYRVTLGRCPCAPRGCWCWHRALLHLLIAGGDAMILMLDQVAAELARARALLDIDAQAAGAVCGVALERALGAVAAALDGPRPASVGRLGWRLWQAGCLTPEQHQAIKRVAKMRARCVHALPTPTPAQVERMIARSYQVVAALAERGES